MSSFFHTILYQPIFNVFVGLYHGIPDVGVVIIIMTVLIKLALYPLTKKSIVAQKALTELQPKIEDLKQKYPGKENQTALATATMALYKEHKVNPFGSCLPILIQLPIFFALYWTFQSGLSSTHFDTLYSFVPNPGTINPLAFGFLDLGAAKSVQSLVLGVLAGVAQWWQTKMMMHQRPKPPVPKEGKDEDMAAMMNKQMLYMMPVVTVLVGYQFPAGLALYWLLSTLITGIQQKMLFAKQKKSIDGPIVSE